MIRPGGAMSRRNDVDDTGWAGPRRRRRGQQPSSRRPKHSLTQRIAGWTSVAVVSMLVAGGLVAYVKYRGYWDSIKRIDVAGLIGNQPPKLNNAENILLIGSDTRSGQDGIGGNQPGCNCSDTLMLLHISPGHHRVTVISIPRDSMVPVMSCAASDGTPGQQAAPGQYERINAALAAGGPACTWKTFETVSNIHIDHFIELDFTGFEKIIDDLGGVTVCLPFAVDDPMSGLDLPKGRHHVFGREALAFWRTREDLGEGSDLQRIQRDQYEMAALVQGMEHSGLLHSPTKILNVIRDATNAMTTDTGLDQNAMLQIADSLRGVTSSAVQFVTVPIVPWPADPTAEVEFDQPQADELFNTIAHDTVLPQATKRSKKQSKKPASSPVLAATPSQVKVDVQNGSGVSGIAAQAGADLTSRGFDVLGTGDASNFNYTSSVIEYVAASDLPAVNTLKAQLSNVQVVQSSALTPGTLDLIIGSSFSALNPPSSSSPSSSSSSKTSAANIGTNDGATITGSASICSDQAAFAGPDS
jgi:LCP family protein required for cell wall assembly